MLAIGGDLGPLWTTQPLETIEDHWRSVGTMADHCGPLNTIADHWFETIKGHWGHELRFLANAKE